VKSTCEEAVEPFGWWWLKKLQAYFQPYLQHIFLKWVVQLSRLEGPIFLGKVHRDHSSPDWEFEFPQIFGDWIREKFTSPQNDPKYSGLGKFPGKFGKHLCFVDFVPPQVTVCSDSLRQ